MKNNETNHLFNFINKALLLVVQQLGVIALITCVVTLFVANYIEVDRGGSISNYKVSPFAVNLSFEESKIFEDFCHDMQREVLRLVVIKDQLEVDGTYNGRKIVDIQDYANRKEDDNVHQDIEEVSAANVELSVYDSAEEFRPCFYLEDLIKWGIYGFDYKELDFEVNDGSCSVYFKNEDGTTESVEWWNSGFDKSFTKEVLEYRYKTIDGVSLFHYAYTVDDYFRLEALLKETVENIYYNYQEYETLNPKWSTQNCNVIYYVTFEKNNQTYFYTNEPTYGIGYPEKQLLEDIQNKGHYIYYSPEELKYETNTAVTQKELLSTLQNYDYFYPENVKIAIGIDTKNYTNNDGIASASAEYSSIVNGGTWYAVLAIASLIVFIVTITLYTMRCLGEKDEDEYKISFWDRLPIELFIVMIGLFIYIWSIFISLLFVWMEELRVMEFGKLYYTSYVGTTAWGYMTLLIVFYYGIIKRIAGGILWNNSLIYRLIRGIVFAYRNVNSFIRTILGFGGILFLNIMLSVIAVNSHYSIIFIPLIIDVIVFVYLVKSDAERTIIKQQISKIREGNFEEKIDVDKMNYQNAILAEGVNNIGEGIRNAVDKSLKDERLKTDLITNVSHDIKTPLTSIINYVDLLKREDLQNEKAKAYVEILETKSQRLKQLTDDLVEASKISSGNIVYYYEKINLSELLHQAEGEFTDRFAKRNLHVVMNLRADNAYVKADSRRIWRVIENLLSNINKYAMEGTRVYIDMENFLEDEEEYISLSMKNISEQPLNIQAEELTERFIRGDVARSTEGSGLGLSIAQNLTVAQGGKFDIHLDGDLFKVVLTFRTYTEE